MLEYGIDAALPDDKISKRKRIVRDAVEEWWDQHGYSPSIVNMDWKQFALNAIVAAREAQPKKARRAPKRPLLDVTPPPGSTNPKKQKPRRANSNARRPRSPVKQPPNQQPTSDEIIVRPRV